MDRITYNPSKFTSLGGRFDVASGMGGSFGVEFRGMEDGKYLFFRPAVNDWPEATYTFTAEEVSEKVYILIPDKYERLMLTDASCQRHAKILECPHIKSVTRY